MKILIPSFLILGVAAFAASTSHKIEITQDSVIEGKVVKAGHYKLSLVNGNAVLTMGKESIEVPAREVNDSNKASLDELTYKNTNNLESIQLGGSTTRIVFEPATPMQSGS